MRRSCIPEEEERFMDMQRKLWKVNHPNEVMPDAAAAADEDEDVIVADSGNELARNVKCPITAVEVRPVRFVDATLLSHLYVMP